MPYKCCVPSCNSNYDNTEEYVTTFSFPTDKERLDLWTRRIPRENLIINKHTRICIKHFEERFIIRTMQLRRPDGTVRNVQRLSPKLTDDAFPSMFLQLPKYLSDKAPVKRKHPDERRAEIDDRSDAILTGFLQEDIIADYDCFKQDLTARVNGHMTSAKWTVKTGSKAVFVYVFNADGDVPELLACIKVNNDMRIQLYVGAVEIASSRLAWVLGESCVLRLWSQLETMLGHYSNYANEDAQSVTDVSVDIECACNILRDVCNAADDCVDDVINVPCILFCIEQLSMSVISSYRRRYSSDLLRYAFLLHTRSSACYRILCGMGKIILPQQGTLRRLAAVFNVNTGLEANDQAKFLKLRASQLSPRERYVVLQLDEIHVNPSLSYKGGDITGVALNTAAESNEPAHTVQAFMISSLFGAAKEIAALCPVKGLTSEYLKPMLQQVLTLVQSSGFIVVVIVSDNNQVNAKAFAEFGNNEDTLTNGIDNPHYPGQRIFFLYDTVHILKCIRNNWINQSDKEQTLIYPAISSDIQQTAMLVHNSPLQQATETRPISQTGPSLSTLTSMTPTSDAAPSGGLGSGSPSAAAVQPPIGVIPMLFTDGASTFIRHCIVMCPTVASHSQAATSVSAAAATVPPSVAPKQTCKAKFSCLKQLYESERKSIVKRAHKLTYKTLYPSNLERQQVALVVNVFNEYNVAALQMLDSETSKQTADFVRLITAWWKIVNVRYPLKGVRSRDELSKPISTSVDPRLEFLSQFAAWLEEWGFGKGCLTQQTHRALLHTTLAIINLTKYVLTNLDVKYILLGKVQTDNLEKRFGEYRQLSGSNYHVSVQQILEAEKKLRLSSVLALRSCKLGHVVVREVQDALSSDETVSAVVPIPPEFASVETEAMDATFDVDEPSLVYIAGFAVHKTVRAVQCDTCAYFLQSDRELQLEDNCTVDYGFVQALDRGGLKYPTLVVILLGYKVLCVLQILVSKKYENAFLKLSKQKALAYSLVLRVLAADDYFQSEAMGTCPNCNKHNMELLTSIIPRFLNVFLGNYTKMCNDAFKASGGKKTKPGESKKRKLKTLTG